MADIIWHDRYNGNYPDPETVCKGKCEGMGVYPEYNKAKKDYDFIKCPECNGTGKRELK
jgi:hypothetical protein